MKISTDTKSEQFSLLPEAPQPQLAAYSDYRVYLRDFYEYKRRQTSGSIRPYSYATFSAGADIRSPNYLKMIIEGQRNLSNDMVKKFAKALGLTKDETEEFSALVDYSQATDPLDRNQHLKKLSELRAQRQVKSGEIKAEALDKVPSWVTWVLYALAEQKDAKFDYDRLYEIMKGKAQRDDIRRSLGRLVQSGDLTIDPETGDINKGRELISGSEDIPVALVRKLQSELIYMALEALFQENIQDREFGAMTVALTEEEFEQLKFELRQFRKRWFKDVAVKRKSGKGDRVFQMNIQLFPLTARSTQK
ncbi:MAG: TIGR02147 family protein [Bdellovibrionales bacterium]